jgi:hypothetical protein
MSTLITTNFDKSEMENSIFMRSLRNKYNHKWINDKFFYISQTKQLT